KIHFTERDNGRGAIGQQCHGFLRRSVGFRGIFLGEIDARESCVSGSSFGAACGKYGAVGGKRFVKFSGAIESQRGGHGRGQGRGGFRAHGTDHVTVFRGGWTRRGCVGVFLRSGNLGLRGRAREVSSRSG